MNSFEYAALLNRCIEEMKMLKTKRLAGRIHPYDYAAEFKELLFYRVKLTRLILEHGPVEDLQMDLNLLEANHILNPNNIV